MPTGTHGLLVCKAPPWAKKDFYLRSPPPWYKNRKNLSDPQKKAAVALGEAAYAAYGKRGKRMYKGVNMPVVAVEVAKAVPKGKKVHGGKTKKERAREAHEAAKASLDSLRALIGE